MAPVIPLDLKAGRLEIFDFTAANTELAHLDINDVAGFTEYLFERIAASEIPVGIGRYNEDRVLYRHSPLFDGAAERRSVHLGIDLFVVESTEIMAPLPAVVCSLADNAGLGDYGPTVILEHEPGRRYVLHSVRPPQPQYSAWAENGPEAHRGPGTGFGRRRSRKRRLAAPPPLSDHLRGDSGRWRLPWGLDTVRVRTISRTVSRPQFRFSASRDCDPRLLSDRFPCGCQARGPRRAGCQAPPPSHEATVTTDQRDRRRAIAALALVVPVPSIGVLAAMVAAPGPFGHAVFLAAKIWLLAFPAGWYLLVERGRASWSPPRNGGLGVGLVSGLAIALVIVVGAWLTGVQRMDLGPLRSAVQEMGLGAPAVYLAAAAGWTLVNSLSRNTSIAGSCSRQSETTVVSERGDPRFGSRLHHPPRHRRQPLPRTGSTPCWPRRGSLSAASSGPGSICATVPSGRVGSATSWPMSRCSASGGGCCSPDSIAAPF